jgi:hypothetical protein
LALTLSNCFCQRSGCAFPSITLLLSEHACALLFRPSILHISVELFRMRYVTDKNCPK